jgi:hypothetical protein
MRVALAAPLWCVPGAVVAHGFFILPATGSSPKSVRELDSAKAAAVTERRELAAMIDTMRGKWKQREWLGWTGIGAFFLGLLISPMFARLLPFGWDGHIGTGAVLVRQFMQACFGGRCRAAAFAVCNLRMQNNLAHPIRSFALMP